MSLVGANAALVIDATGTGALRVLNVVAGTAAADANVVVGVLTLIAPKVVPGSTGELAKLTTVTARLFSIGVARFLFERIPMVSADRVSALPKWKPHQTVEPSVTVDASLVVIVVLFVPVPERNKLIPVWVAIVVKTPP